MPVRRYSEYRLLESAGNENPIIRYVSEIARISSGAGKDYYSQMLNDIKPIECRPLREVFTDDEIERIRRAVHPKTKACYENAFHFSSRLGELGREILYCEGFVTVFGLPIEHAFNKVDGVYVDITLELALGDDITGRDYAVLGEWTDSKALAVMAREGYYGEVYRQEFFERYKENVRK